MELIYIVKNEINLRQVLKEHFGISNRFLLRLKQNRKIYVNNSNNIYLDMLVKENDLIKVNLDFEENNSNIVSMKIDLNILYEDDIEVANIEIKPTTTEDQPKRNQSINIKGKVVYMGEVRKETAGVETYVQDEIVSANSQIKITLSGTDPDKKQPDIIYNLTTDDKGE